MFSAVLYATQSLSDNFEVCIKLTSTNLVIHSHWEMNLGIIIYAFESSKLKWHCDKLTPHTHSYKFALYCFYFAKLPPTVFILIRWAIVVSLLSHSRWKSCALNLRYNHNLLFFTYLSILSLYLLVHLFTALLLPLGFKCAFFSCLELRECLLHEWEYDCNLY